MSWQLVSFAILAAVLVSGFVWWERSRPPSRLVALVAALAALAVAGRLIFAPVPNLVATTDIALLTGYALGGPPGFAVGALAAPISNIWLGQGPWTAWQMAGWGLVGLGGAAIAAATGRRLGRLGLATVCGLAGFAYGALLDLSVMVTYGGEQSLDRYLALSSRGVPFNVVHAAGNFALAFAAGPALVRLISRYRTRLEFTWRPAAAIPLAAAPRDSRLALTPVLGRPAGSGREAEHSGGIRTPVGCSAADWLAARQNDDGGFAASPGPAFEPGDDGWVVLGLEAAGRNPLDVESGGEDAISYLESEADRVRSVGDLERTILALAGRGPRPDLVRRPRSRRPARRQARRRRLGRRPGEPDRLLRARDARGRGRRLRARPLAALARPAPRPTTAAGDSSRAPSAIRTPPARRCRRSSPRGRRASPSAPARRYLRRAQGRNGGFALSTSGVVNSQSTAWAVQGMVAAGVAGKPRRSALDYMDSLQASDGHYRYSPASDQTPVWVTAQALLAVNGARSRSRRSPARRSPRLRAGRGLRRAPSPATPHPRRPGR